MQGTLLKTRQFQLIKQALNKKNKKLPKLLEIDKQQHYQNLKALTLKFNNEFTRKSLS